jgi:diacylglycerol kinase (ATP)
MYGAIRVLTRFQFPLVKLKGDFGQYEGRVLLVATGNSFCYGGAMKITPAAKMDDGKFQICIVEQVPKLTVLRIFPRVMKGSHITHPAVRMLETRSLQIESPDRPLTICADGEALCQTPCTLEVKPGALTVLSP